MSPILLLAACLATGFDDRADNVDRAVKAKTQVIAQAGIKLSAQDRAGLVQMERDFQVARSITRSISECLDVMTEPHHEDSTRKLLGVRDQVGKVLALMAGQKDSGPQILAKVRAYAKQSAAYRAKLDSAADSAARIRFALSQEVATLDGGWEVLVLSAPNNSADLRFGLQLQNLVTGMSGRFTGRYLNIAAVSNDRRAKQLSELKSSATLEVGSYNGETLEYRTRDGRMSTTWSLGDESYVWTVKPSPTGSVTWAYDDIPGTNRTMRKGMILITARSHRFEVEISAKGEVTWHQESVRNGRSTTNRERNPVQGSVRLRVLTL